MTRLVVAALAAWAASAAVLLAAGSLPLLVVLVGCVMAAAAVAGVVRWRRPSTVGWTDLGVLAAVVLLAGGAAVWRVQPLISGPVHEAAGSFMRAGIVTSSDPRVVDGRTSGSRRTEDSWAVEADLVRMVVAGDAVDVDVPVLVVSRDPGAGGALASTLPGTPMQVSGRLLHGDPRRGRAATLVVERAEATGGAGAVQQAAAAVRTSMRAAVSDRPPEVRGLLPGLVVGDTSALRPDLEQAMRDSGLAHLTAVSGGNVAVVIALVVVAGRILGLRRGRTRLVVVASAVAGYVVVARPEPSVVRAAAMAGVVLLAMLLDRRPAPGAALAVSVVGLLLLDPFLALSLGFAMSVAATAALVVVAVRAGPRLVEGRWGERLRAGVVAAALVSVAAQIAVAPLIAAIGGGVPLGGVPANLLAAPAVGPATALGLLASLVGLVSPAAAHVVALPAGWAVSWIALVATSAASIAGSLPWPDGLAGAAWLAAVLLLGGAGWWLARRFAGPLVRLGLAGTACGCLLVVASPVPLPVVTAWPPAGWRIAMCDVGQGDAVVLRVADGEGVVVDTGPEPELVDACLRRLGIRRVPLVVLTHFHADHVEGLPGVLHGRTPGLVVVSPLDDPPGEEARVRRWLGERGVPVRAAAPGDRWTVGPVRLQVVWPTRFVRGEGSPANNASVTIVADVDGVTAVLGGDLETESQDALLALGVLRPVDVVKVPHHGSRYQSRLWASTLRPRFAVIGVGEGNEYGHPARETLASYAARGSVIGRTDLDGDLAVVLDHDGTLALLRRGR